MGIRAYSSRGHDYDGDSGNRGLSILSDKPRKGYAKPYMELLSKAVDSKQLTDPFGTSYDSPSAGGNNTAIEPVYSFSQLSQLLVSNNTLRQCIESYVINIESYGHVLEYIGPEGKMESDEAKAEASRLEQFLDAPSSSLGLREIRERLRWDKESMGNGFYEIIRNVKGEITLMDHMPSISTRLTRREAQKVEATILIKDENGEFIQKKVMRSFRKFVQKSSDGRVTYFKEFGDPRVMDATTGEYKSVSKKKAATEVYHDCLYCPGSVYGMPRWIGQLPAVLGSRESEIVNLNFFRENAIPAMAVLISGGALTGDSFDRLEQIINAVRGRDAMNRVLVLEAAADEASGTVDHSQPAPKIEMKPMISERQQEGLFQDYDAKNAAKVRSSFRLPPIYVGRAEDYTRASAHASMLTAENQIFQPERLNFDDFMNNRILLTYKPKYWRFRSVGPSIAEPESLSRMIDSFGKQGALSANAVIKIANKILDVKVDSITESWGDAPFQIVMDTVRRGGIISGLSDFIDNLDDLTLDSANNNSNDNSNDKDKPDDIKKVIRNAVRQEIGIIRSDLEDLQTFATVAAE